MMISCSSIAEAEEWHRDYIARLQAKIAKRPISDGFPEERSVIILKVADDE